VEKNIVEIPQIKYFGACAVHAVKQRLQTHTQNMQYFLLLHSKSDYVNAPKYHYMCNAWPVYSSFMLVSNYSTPHKVCG